MASTQSGSRSERRYRRKQATMVVLIVVFTMAFGVATAANIGTVTSPAPALLGFFARGQ